MKHNFKDITGQRFGLLVTLQVSDRDKNNKTVWECMCDCGNVCKARRRVLINGTKKSCGCLPTGRKRLTTTRCKHGHEYTEKNLYTHNGKRHCRICRCARVKESYARNRERVRTRKQARRKLRPDLTPEQRRRANLRYIGWTPETFAAAVQEQKGLCDICKKVLTFENKISGSRACADHEHSKPPKPRGVLCINCNLGIGNLQDNPAIMQAAIAYVTKHKKEG